MKKFVSLFKKPGVLIGILLALFLACLIVIIALFMGQEAGNFVIQVEGGDKQKAIQIGEKKFGTTSTRLEAPSATEMQDTTYRRFQGFLDKYHEDEGLTIDEATHVYAYTFWMTNEGAETVQITATMYYSNATNNLDKAVRILTISDTSNPRMCYQAMDDQYTDYEADYPSVTYFLDERRIYEEKFLSVDPGDKIKYTIVIWLEGKDPDCTDAIRLGQIRFALKLSV